MDKRELDIIDAAEWIVWGSLGFLFVIGSVASFN